jgi:hypothetical protein
VGKKNGGKCGTLVAREMQHDVIEDVLLEAKHFHIRHRLDSGGSFISSDQTNLAEKRASHHYRQYL